MHKMREPEMVVVRFTESDVIVASGESRPYDVIAAKNFTDSGPESMGNGTFSFGGNEYNSNSAFMSALRNAGYTGSVANFYPSGATSPVTSQYAYDYDLAGWGGDVPDGNYTYDGESGWRQ